MENPNMKINQERINELKSFALEAGSDHSNWVNHEHRACSLKPKREELVELEKQLQNEQEENSKNKELLLNAQKQIEAELGEALLISDYVLAGKKIAELRAQQEVVTMRLEALNDNPFYHISYLWSVVQRNAAAKALDEKMKILDKKIEELLPLAMQIKYLKTISSPHDKTTVGNYIESNFSSKSYESKVDLTAYY